MIDLAKQALEALEETLADNSDLGLEDHLAIGRRVRAAIAALRSYVESGGGKPDGFETYNSNSVTWALSRWEDEVKNRPLVNVHRRTLDDTWRQVIRHFGGDPEALLGPAHDALWAAQLWCVHVEGPDDVYAAASREAARKHADTLNKAIDRMPHHPDDPICRAVVAVWPHSPESHAESLATHLAQGVGE